MRSTRRTSAVLAVVALLALGAALDQEPAPEPREVLPAPAVLGMPTAGAAAARSSTWFCAGGTSVPDGPANVTLVVANVTEEERTGVVTWVSGDPAQAPVVQPIEVGPRSVTSLPATDVIQSTNVAATVELDGGGVGVEHTVGGEAGSLATAPCASDASDEWHLAYGSTLRGATELLALYNPFPDDAIVDVTFATDQGRALPQSLADLVIEARRVKVVDIGQHAVNRRVFASATILARSGRVVVDRIQRFDGTEGRRGMGLALATPAPNDVWYFPDGQWLEGLSERYYLYNPSEQEATVDLAFVVDGAEVQPEPIERTIGPFSTVEVDIGADGRVPPNAGHAAIVTSVNGVDVVVERVSASTGAAARRGFTSTFGAHTPAPRWLFAAGGPTDAVDEWIVVHNPGAATVTVSLIGLDGGQLRVVDELQDIELGPAERRAVRLGSHVERESLAVVVEASGPVVAERGLFSAAGVGISSAVGIPLR